MTRSPIIVLALAIGACSPDATTPPPDDPTPWYEGFDYRRAIDILPPPGALADIPISIPFTGEALSVRQFDYLDLMAGDGMTSYSFEMVRNEEDPAQFELWARPRMVEGPTRLYLYYGGDIIVDHWGSAFGDFRGAWHMFLPRVEDEPYEEWDSSRVFGWLGAAPGAPSSAQGISGLARRFDGIDDGLEIVETHRTPDFAMESFTYSLWVNEDEAVDVNDTPLYKGGIGLSQPGYSMLLGSGAWVAQLHDGTRAVQASLGSEVRGAWRHLTAVVDREAQQLRSYVDGALTDTVDISTLGSLATPEPFLIGRSATQPFRGVIDEVRIYPGVLSGARIAAEFANLTNPSMVTVGPEQTRP